jgi:hypothetical protein
LNKKPGVEIILTEYKKRKMDKEKKKWLWQKKLFDEKIDVKAIEHKKLHFNCEIEKIEQWDVNAGERPLDMEKE